MLSHYIMSFYILMYSLGYWNSFKICNENYISKLPLPFIGFFRESIEWNPLNVKNNLPLFLFRFGLA